MSPVVYDSIKSMLLTAQVCKAITELSSTLGDLENTFTRKMEQFLQERPELNNHVTGLKEDIADLIKVLSEKLTGEGDAEAAIDEEVSIFSLVKDTRLCVRLCVSRGSAIRNIKQLIYRGVAGLTQN